MRIASSHRHEIGTNNNAVARIPFDRLSQQPSRCPAACRGEHADAVSVAGDDVSRGSRPRSPSGTGLRAGGGRTAADRPVTVIGRGPAEGGSGRSRWRNKPLRHDDLRNLRIAFGRQVRCNNVWDRYSDRHCVGSCNTASCRHGVVGRHDRIGTSGPRSYVSTVQRRSNEPSHFVGNRYQHVFFGARQPRSAKVI